MPAADHSGLKDFRINHHNKMKATRKGGFFWPPSPLLVTTPTSYPYPEFVGQKTNEGEYLPESNHFQDRAGKEISSFYPVKNPGDYSGWPEWTRKNQGNIIETSSFIPSDVANFFFVFAVKKRDSGKQFKSAFIHDRISE